jgi:predicted nucleotidyltransferase
MTPKFFTSTVPKFAFIGTSCSGKTTATYSTCAYLKQRGVRVDGILQQDRRLPFSPDLLDKCPEAQHWFLSNMMTTESYLVLQKGTDCIVSDRSVVDFFAYYVQSFGEDFEYSKFIDYWTQSYECLYYLEPREYDNDGVRPSNDFRTQVDSLLLEKVNSLIGLGFKIKKVDSWEEAARDILIKTKLSLFEKHGIPFILTGSYSKRTETPKSDFDVVVSEDDIEKLKSVYKKSIGLAKPKYLNSIKHKYNDYDLKGIAILPKYNVEIQITSDFEKRKALEQEERKPFVDSFIKQNLLHKKNRLKCVFSGPEMEGPRIGQKTLFFKNITSIEDLSKVEQINNPTLPFENIYLGAGCCSDTSSEVIKKAKLVAPVTLEVDTLEKVKQYLPLLRKAKDIIFLTIRLQGKYTDLYNSLDTLFIPLSDNIFIKDDDGKHVNIYKLKLLKEPNSHKPLLDTFDSNTCVLDLPNCDLIVYPALQSIFDGYPKDTILYHDETTF